MEFAAKVCIVHSPWKLLRKPVSFLESQVSMSLL